MTKYEEALKRQLGYNPARNYAAAAGGGKRKVIFVLLNFKSRENKLSSQYTVSVFFGTVPVVVLCQNR